METLFLIIVFIFGVLQIILFFKIWGMTNDVDKITQIIERFERQQLTLQTQKPEDKGNNNLPNTKTSPAINFEVGDAVYYFNKPLLISRDNGDGTFACTLPDGKKYDDSIEGKQLRKGNI